MTKNLVTDEEYDRHAAAAVWTGERVETHVLSEFTNDTDKILATVAPHDNLVYGVGWPDETGTIKVHGLASREAARGHYNAVREVADVLEWRPFTELRTGWYVFYDGVVTMRYKPDNIEAKNESVVLFPMSADDGILGELAWSIHPDAKHADRNSDEVPNPPPLTKLENMQILDDLMAASQAGDVSAIAKLLSDDIGSALRDYAKGEPYHDIQGKQAAVAYYEGFFNTFDVAKVDLVNRVIGEWFFFAELQWTARARAGTHAGEQVRFCTAVMYMVNNAGLIHAQLGYGTDPVRLP